MRRIIAVDSHTGGEPTRVIVDGGPDLGAGSLAQRRERFVAEHDWLRRAAVDEPRGTEATVGALVCKPEYGESAAGVIYFDRDGCLQMCGHGTIGLVVTLGYLGRIERGPLKIETPVGVVSAQWIDRNRASFENIACRRAQKGVAVKTQRFGAVRGDVVWGGNWFFLISDPVRRLEISDAPALLEFTLAVRQAVWQAGVVGDDDARIGHVALFRPSPTPRVDFRNFILCPSGTYDRSPCGTGSSALLACLAADGLLAEGETICIESIAGSRFEGKYRREGDCIRPTISGEAYITAETTLLIDANDPLEL